MATLSSRLSIWFSAIGHFQMHLLAAIYLTAILSIEQSWKVGYDELIGLWFVGSLLIAILAPLAGWIGDRWSESWMMVIFFVVTGLGSIATGFAEGTTALAAGLSLLGFGAAIYHPVGLAWVVRNAERPGSALAWVGIAGAFGVSLTAVVTGFFIDLISWRAAFVIPGAITVATGGLLWLCILRGIVRDPGADVRPQPKQGRSDMIRAFVILSVTMFCAGLIWNTTQMAMPKWFDQRMTGLLGSDVTAGVGMLVTLVYLCASCAQLAGGWAADRFPLKHVYAASLLVQAPLLLVAASLSNIPLFVVAVLMVFMSSFQIPAESLMLARYTPPKHRGLAFGAKFVLSFGAAPFGVAMISWVWARDHSFFWVFAYLAACALLSAAAAWLLPSESAEEEKTAARGPAAVPFPSVASGVGD